MANEKKDEHTNIVLVCAGVVAFAGLVIAIVAGFASSSPSLITVDKLVRLNAGANHGSVPTFTTIRIYQALIGVGVGIIAAATLGLLGANKRSKPLIAVYLGFTVLFSIVMFLSGAGLLMRITAVTPIIDRQVVDFCNATTYTRLAGHLNCPGVTTNQPCNAVCDNRVGQLSRYGGCDFLPDLCTRQAHGWEYTTDQSMGRLVTSSAPSYFIQTNAEECNQVCNADIHCDGYTTPLAGGTSGCYIRSTVQPSHSNPQNAGADTVVYSKNRPHALPAFHSYGRKLAFSVFALAVVILFSMIATCCHLYTVNVKRTGKHTGPELCATLLCPCWGKAPHEKIAEMEALADDSEDE